MGTTFTFVLSFRYLDCILLFIFLTGTLKCKHLVNHKLMRWSPAAHNICYTNYIHAMFFSLGKSVALHRSDGVYQRGMDFLSDRLKEGHWVHFFPEGEIAKCIFSQSKCFLEGILKNTRLASAMTLSSEYPECIDVRRKGKFKVAVQFS